MKKTPADEADELRAVVQDAHGAIKDLTRLIREAREVMAEVKTAAHDAVEKDLNEAITEGLGTLTGAIEKAITDATEAVDRRFDTIASIMLGEDPKSQRAGEPSLTEYAQRIVERDGPRVVPKDRHE